VASNVVQMDTLHQVENSRSIDAHLCEEQSCQISSRSDLERRSLGLFGRGRPNKNKKKNKIIILSLSRTRHSSWAKNKKSTSKM